MVRMKTLKYKIRQRGLRTWDPPVEVEHHADECESAPGYFIERPTNLREGALGHARNETAMAVRTEAGQVLAKVVIRMPEAPRYSPEPTPARVMPNQWPSSTLTIEQTRAVAELLQRAASFADDLMPAFKPLFAEAIELNRKREEARVKREEEYQREREARQAIRRAEAEKRQAFINERVEALQWYIGQPMRLKRFGKRSVVMGQVTDINDRTGTMQILTERGAHWRSYVDSLTFFEIKYEGDRSYTEIELPPPPDGLELRPG